MVRHSSSRQLTSVDPRSVAGTGFSFHPQTNLYREEVDDLLCREVSLRQLDATVQPG